MRSKEVSWPKPSSARSAFRTGLRGCCWASPLALAHDAWAQNNGASLTGETRIDYDIPAQPLASALALYAQQSGLSTLVPVGRSLCGPICASGSWPLHARRRAVSIAFQIHFRGEITPANTLALEQDQSLQLDSANAEAERACATAQSDPDANAEADEEIVVTGTRIRGRAAPAGSNLIELSREDLDATGRLTLQDALQTLPQNFAGSQNEGTVEGSLNARRSNFSAARLSICAA